jgi:hypothetical protein
VSSSSAIPLWGQAWELTVQYATSDGGTSYYTLTRNAWEPEALRMTFEVVQSTLPSPWWYADINVYNLTAQDAQNILFNATWVALKAGFQTGDNLYSTIWSGPVLQTLYDRERVVDQHIQIRCIASPLLSNNVVAFSMGPRASQLQFVSQMINEVNYNAPANVTPMALDFGQVAQQRMDGKQYLRGNTMFGKMDDQLNTATGDNYVQWWRDGRKAYASELSNADLTPSLIYSPPFPPDSPYSTPPAGVTQSLIGTPRQTPFGVIFNVLLDPRLLVQVPLQVVQLQRVAITQLAQTPNPAGGNAVTPFSNNLTFFVGQVRHYGDTRGNDWCTEVTGYSTTYGDNLLNGIFAANKGAP